MATLGDLLVRIVGDNSQLDGAIDKSEKKLADFAKSAEKIGKNLTKFVTLPLAAAATGFLYLADQQAQAEAALTNAIKATGKEASISVPNLKRLASEMQNLTTFGDEAQLTALALTQQLANLDEDGLKAVLPGMLDFATAMGVDLQSAASLVGKTLGSSTNALARYGIELDTTASPTEKLAQLTEQLEAKFGGAAATAAAAGLGPLKQLKNSIGDLGESFGMLLLPAVTNIIAAIRGLVDRLSALSEEQMKTILIVGALAAAIGPLILVVTKLSAAVSFLAANPLVLAAAAVIALTAVVAKMSIENAKAARWAAEISDAVETEAARVKELNEALTDLSAAQLEVVRTQGLMALAVNKGSAGGGFAGGAPPPAGGGGGGGGGTATEIALVEELAEKLRNLDALSQAGAFTEIEILERKLELRQELIDSLIDEAEEGTITAEQLISTREAQLEVIQKYLSRLKEIAAAGKSQATENRKVAVDEEEIATRTRANLEEQAARIDRVFEAKQRLIQAGKDAEIARQEEHAREMARLEEERNTRISLAQSAISVVTAIASAADAATKRKLALLDQEYERQKAIYGDSEELAKAFQAKREEIEYQGALKSWKLNLLAGLASAALGVVSAFANTKGDIVIKSIAAGIAALLGAAQVAAINSAKPVAMATGGIVTPSPGGTLAQVAEAGQPEVIFPLDRLEEFLSARGGDTLDEGTVHLVVNMDSKPILDQIFPATRNGTVLIAARAVIGAM